MKLQVVKCSLVGLLGVLFLSNVQAMKHDRQLCEAIGETCITYRRALSSRSPRCWFLLDFPNNKCCNEKGKFQSPIDIPDVKKKFIVRHKLRYSSKEFKGSLENNGHQPILKKDTDDRVYLEGVRSKDGKRYYLQNVNFHVGPDDEKRQTEHLKNGKTFDGEAQIVHVREDFDSVREAATDPQGLLIISIFLTTSGTGKRSDAFDDLIEEFTDNKDIRYFEEEDGPCLLSTELVKYLDVVGVDIDGNKFEEQCGKRLPTTSERDVCNYYLSNGECGDKSKETIDPNELLSDKPEYYIYSGSLTMPPCSEAVVWLVARRPRRVADSYTTVVQSFTNVIDNLLRGPGNLRPLQDLEGRKVYLLRFDPSFRKGIFERIRKGKNSASDADADGDTMLKDNPLSMIM